MNDNKLFVGNLSFNTTENELQDLFAQHGNVTEAKLITDRETGRARGFAFITMSTPEEAQAAIGALNGTNLDGRDIAVSVAKPREERGGGGSRGGSGGGGGRRREFSGGRNRY